MSMNIFHLGENKGLIWTVITTSRINIFAWATFLYGKRCDMYRVHCLNYIVIEWPVYIENHIFFNKVLQNNIFLNKWIWIIRWFQMHCHLLQFTIRDTPFKTKLTTLVNARGPTDRASLKIVRITAATLGAITDLNVCWAVYLTCSASVKYFRL